MFQQEKEDGMINEPGESTEAALSPQPRTY
jgi:hypothetical protein